MAVIAVRDRALLQMAIRCVTYWDEYYQEFLRHSTENEKCFPRLHPSFRTLTTKLHEVGESLAIDICSEDIDWLTKGLGKQRKKYFATYPIFGMGNAVPEELFLPLMRAAIDESDPSYCAYFVEPCVRSFGHRQVNEHLFDVFEEASNPEKARAVNALYHAQLPVAYRPITDGNEVRYEFDVQSHARYSELEDVWSRKRRLFLAEFMRNEDLDFKKFMVPRISWSPDCYSKDELLLLESATELAVTLCLFDSS